MLQFEGKMKGVVSGMGVVDEVEDIVDGVFD